MIRTESGGAVREKSRIVVGIDQTWAVDRSRLEYLYLYLGHPGATRRLEQVLRSKSFDAFCMNDTPAPGDRAAGRSRVLGEFLERYYPLKSSFEV